MLPPPTIVAASLLKRFCFSWLLRFRWLSVHQLERDALVQGFAMLVEDLKAAADEERFRDAEAGRIRDI